MDKIIFLDIDGVLNSRNTFIETQGLRKMLNLLLKHNKEDTDLILKLKLLDIDHSKLILLKEIIDNTKAKIVITSAWRMLGGYPLVEDYFINLGLPIIGITKKLNDRGEEILDYINEHQIKEYIIIDDEIFNDFSDEFKYNLIRTNFYDEGLTEEHVFEAIKRLK